MKIVELDKNKGEFKVTEEYSKIRDLNEREEEKAVTANEEQTDTMVAEPNTVGQVTKMTRNIVIPEQETCTCGKWQEYKYPCRHGCA